MERKPWREKLKLISRKLNTDFDAEKQPFQSMVKAFAFRNLLAHGKSIINEEFSGQFTLGGHAENSYLNPEWVKEYQSLKMVKALLDNMDLALQELRSAAGLQSEPLGLIAEGEAEGQGG